MRTEIIDINQIKRAADVIKAGGVVAFPTETVYGLGADAFNPDAVAQIFEVKGRPQDNPLIVHIADSQEVKKLARDIPEVFYTLEREFMPGPLTVVLKKSDAVPPVVVAGGDTVGIRMPAHAAAIALIKESGVPIAAPSANSSSHISPTRSEHVFNDLGGKIPFVIDGGACEIGIESTVLDLTSDIPTILRPGAVTAEMLSRHFTKLGKPELGIKIAKSPGMKYRHYAPYSTAVLAADLESAMTFYDKKVAEGKKPVILLKTGESAGARQVIYLGKDGAEAAKNIYAALRTAEAEFDFIIIEKPEGSGIGEAILNRLYKATEPIVSTV
ncbi:MAG TPA: L-threonylcarbamoyladenylate synthase [Eubacteriales bacterium]|nr:L-threonylcarbamoyladenylate synthase [Clostridia bacterium]HRR89973.1 L-threonylcarbamoyladenylate synthase [Eubacteriales bacterium]HRU84409.1 L-threonylcarbamoyladenylate synthase [Eubacteriales bacterium]